MRKNSINLHSAATFEAFELKTAVFPNVDKRRNLAKSVTVEPVNKPHRQTIVSMTIQVC